ncbi:MAG: DNA-binding protein [Halobacteriales archaeon]|nr:DNA-binding protein [Halobacteriales archaeon]
MNSKSVIGDKATVEGQRENELQAAVVDEVREREQWLEPSVEQETQAKVDYADDREWEGRLFGQTLEAEERMRAREWEIERTRKRWDRSQDSDREARCRNTVVAVNEARRSEFGKRAASVDPWVDPDEVDARAQLSREVLAAVNRESARIAERLRGFSTAAISRLVAQRVVDGQDVRDAALAVFEELRSAPGQVVPIGLVDEVSQREIDIEGTVVKLWKPSHPSIQQVGLLKDETERIKFTAWKKSKVPRVEEGEQVRFRNVAMNWYRGRVSVALTGSSRVVVVA